MKIGAIRAGAIERVPLLAQVQGGVQLPLALDSVRSAPYCAAETFDIAALTLLACTGRFRCGLLCTGGSYGDHVYKRRKARVTGCAQARCADVLHEGPRCSDQTDRRHRVRGKALPQMGLQSQSYLAEGHRLIKRGSGLGDLVNTLSAFYLTAYRT